MEVPGSTLLHQHELRSTPARRSILRQLAAHKAALTVQELEAETESDRITIYRTLQAFEEKGLVHRVSHGNSADRFALCRSGKCTPANHQHNHAHFHCTQCNTIRCLPEQAASTQLSLSKGYTVNKMELNLTGICNTCNQ